MDTLKEPNCKLPIFFLAIFNFWTCLTLCDTKRQDRGNCAYIIVIVSMIVCPMSCVLYLCGLKI